MPNDSLRKTFEEKFPTVSMRIKNSDGTTSEVYAGTAILSLLTEQVALARASALNEVLNIELAPDARDMDTVKSLNNPLSAFGYGQVWIMSKVEKLLSPAPIIPEGEK